MGKRNRMRAGIAALGIGAVAAATVLPGALAAVDDGAVVTVTRAALSQGDVNGEISRTTLVTQIQADGQGQASFTVPVGAGSDPKYMDSFGGPDVQADQATYNLDVDGTQVIRTQQDFPPDEVPVRVSVEATLDGQPIAVDDLDGADGLATLTWTYENTTAEPTKVKFPSPDGTTIRSTQDIPVPLAGSITMLFDESWQELQSDQADVVSGDGQGNTQVQWTLPLMVPPFGEISSPITVEGRITSAVIPPVDAKFAVVAPQDNPTTAKLTEQLASGGDAGAQIADAGVQLGDGLALLSEGLVQAVDGSGKIADGVGGTLGPGVASLASGVENTLGPGVQKLDDGALELFQKAAVEGHQTAIGASAKLQNTARTDKAYCGPNYPTSCDADSLLGGLTKLSGTDGLMKATDTIQKIVHRTRSNGDVSQLGQIANPGDYSLNGGKNWTKPILTTNLKGIPNTFTVSDQSLAGALWASTFGVRQQDTGVALNEQTRNGLTNPDCQLADAMTLPGEAINDKPPGYDSTDADWPYKNAAREGLQDRYNPLKRSNPCGMVQILDFLETNLNDHVWDLTKSQLGGALLMEKINAALTTESGGGGLPWAQIYGGGAPHLMQNIATDAGCTWADPTKVATLDCTAAANPAISTPLTSLAHLLYEDQVIFGLTVPSIGSAISLFQDQLGRGSWKDLDSGCDWDNPKGAQWGPKCQTTSLRFALKSIRKGVSNMQSGAVYDQCPTGFKPEVADTKQRPYNCVPASLDTEFVTWAGISTGRTLTGALMGLAIKLPGFYPKVPTPFQPLVTNYGPCALFTTPSENVPVSPTPSDDEVTTTCTLRQVLRALSMSIGDNNVIGQRGQLAGPQGPVRGDDLCKDFVNDKNASDTATAVCAVANIRNGIDQQLLPTIGDGVQKETLETIGSGKYTPNCDPDVNATLSCALSILRDGTGQLNAGVNGPTGTSDPALVDAVAQLNAGVNGPTGTADPSLVEGTRTLADGLPAAVDGVQQLDEQGAQQLQQQGTQTADEFNAQVASIQALNDRAETGDGIPGGAPEGVTSFGGVWAFELAGAGGTVGNNMARLGLVALGLLLAAGVGVFVAGRPV